MIHSWQQRSFVKCSYQLQGKLAPFNGTTAQDFSHDLCFQPRALQFCGELHNE